MSAPTPAEMQLVGIFRSRISTFKMAEGESTDEHLLRWIRAREGDLQKSEDMLRKHLIWRKDRGIGPSLLDWIPPPFIAATYPIRLLGFDRTGSPIIFLTFGLWDFRKAIERGEKQSMIRYKDKILEQLMCLMKFIQGRESFNKSVTQFISLSDWEGFSIRYIMNKDVVDLIVEAAKSFEANYPETLKAAFNINCPKVFSVLFNLIKPFLSERTLSKIFIFDSNAHKWKPELGKTVPRQLLPLKYREDLKPNSDVLRETEERTVYKLADMSLKILKVGDEYENEKKNETLEKIIKESAQIAEENDKMKGKLILRVAPGYKVNVPCKKGKGDKERKLTPGCRIEWDFSVEEKDISFGVLREAVGVGVTPGGGSVEEVIEGRKVQGSEKGSLICEKEGHFFLSFDNTHSMFKAKVVNYSVKVDNPFSI